MREWRAGGTSMRLSADERALMLEIRQAQAAGAEVTVTTVAAGRHHATA
jgi:hypothetical protein